ncbi:MAG: amino acid permease [Alphaproteobacteria bacterium]
MTYEILRRWTLGHALDPLHGETRRKLALVTILAWIGLGADGLSSANYGPEEAFLALGEHRELGLFLVIATAATVTLIAAAYAQVIELFPTGGGGYKVASQLLHAHAGVITGAALVVDYVLTVAISIAAAVDAAFSLLPSAAAALRLPAGFVLVLLLTWLNLRGMKESLALMAPIFFGFILTHGLLILAGIGLHADGLVTVTASSIGDATSMAEGLGWFAVVAILVKAYAVGAGTYTGIEAVSNNVHVLAEPRVKTGKRTMALLAASLALTAGGVMLLYLLWDVRPEAGQTLNAVVFREILHAVPGLPPGPATVALNVTLLLATALLLVAANTGFLGGPAVLANLAIDRWMPHAFADLSSRLVTKIGILVIGLAAAALYLLAGADVGMLVILYSINVFLAFSLSLLGLVRHRLRERLTGNNLFRLAVAASAALVSWLILIALVIGEFTRGAWLAVTITGGFTLLCFAVRRHYERVAAALKEVERLLVERRPPGRDAPAVAIDRSARTAAFLVGPNLGSDMHAFFAVQRMFPRVFANYVFVSVGEVDAQSFGGDRALERLKQEVGERLAYFRGYCRSHGLPNDSYAGFGTNAARELTGLCEQVRKDYPNAVFFASRIILEPDNWLTRTLHNRTAIALQRRLHLKGMPMMIVPMLLDISGRPSGTTPRPLVEGSTLALEAACRRSTALSTV